MAGNSHAADVRCDAQFGLASRALGPLWQWSPQNSMPINPDCGLVGLGGVSAKVYDLILIRVKGVKATKHADASVRGGGNLSF